MAITHFHSTTIASKTYKDICLIRDKQLSCIVPKKMPQSIVHSPLGSSRESTYIMFLVFGQVYTCMYTVLNAMPSKCKRIQSLPRLPSFRRNSAYMHIITHCTLTSRLSGLMASSIWRGNWGTLLLIQKICKLYMISAHIALYLSTTWRLLHVYVQ